MNVKMKTGLSEFSKKYKIIIELHEWYFWPTKQKIYTIAIGPSFKNVY